MVAIAMEVLRHRTALCVKIRRPALCSHVLTQQRDSLEGPRRAAVQTRKEGRGNDTLVASRVAGETVSLSSTTKDLSSRDRPLWNLGGKSRNGLLPCHGAHPPRPECHSPLGEGRLAVRLVPATMRREFSGKPVVRSLMPVLPSITPSDSRHASRAPDTAPSSSGSRSPDGSPRGATPITV